jgi:cyclopropane-fatty-acyl-phospholipid synthase
MSVSTTSPDLRLPARKLSLGTRALRRTVLSRLGALQRGRITVVDGEHRHVVGRPTSRCPLQAELRVHDPSFWGDIALGGSIGAAEAYARGAWSADDLATLLRVVAANPEHSGRVDHGPARLARAAGTLLHRLRVNTRRGSRKNISAHYDLGNDFFELFLDPTMMYSCALFEDPAESLEAAARRKVGHVCRKLELRPEDTLLEIGSGWGGFAIHAAREYGCRVVTTTISREQHALARERVRQAGLQDRVEVLMRDYRDLPSLGRRFDKLVSIEMIEAVGHRYLDRFFEVCAEMLKPGGRMALQAILIRDCWYEGYRRSVDFIRRYIFPGGHLPSLGALTAAMGQSSDLSVDDLEDITPHYVTTLEHWRRRFHERLARVRELGYSESFVRLWEFYLCYCEAGFAEGWTSTAQLVLSRPGRRC